MGIIKEHDEAERNMTLALHGVEVKEDGGVTRGGKSGLLAYHQQRNRKKARR